MRKIKRSFISGCKEKSIQMLYKVGQSIPPKLVGLYKIFVIFHMHQMDEKYFT